MREEGQIEHPTNRLRLYNLTKDSDDIKAQFRWETINAVIYTIGGLVFITGSILFFPRLAAYADLGAYIFLGGSLLYLVVTVHDLIEVRRQWWTNKKRGLETILEYVAAASYLWGTILFTVGSVYFLSAIRWTRAGAWCLVVGSLLFVVGAGINVLQIVSSSTIKILKSMNLTAVSFVVGSVRFTLASIPYLWTVQAEAQRYVLYTFLAWQYLVGSILFFTGDLFNYWRAYTVVQGAKKNHPAMTESG